ncbi:metal ABC transporter substrate-binding protein [Psychrobacter lutiphocae]|uniref:metal ABC transporter substrate-binding protein n=1 Tax=Psychrobacter lutiphocae TaxID=540500 RepID=UPI00036C6A97|nr:metal ABC transporter substrate-binding protein [Psychrobacter lutiphocae]
MLVSKLKKNKLNKVKKSLCIALLSIAPVLSATYHSAQAVETTTTTSSSLAKKVKPKSWRHISIDALPDSIRNKTQVAVSNYPLFLLSQAVTKGAPSAKLLLEPGDVGHHGSLSPGDMKTVKDSRYVVWFGNELESNLVKSVGGSVNSISLFELNAFYREPLRDVKGVPIKDTLDPHIWLNPENAKAITRALGAIFSRANPEYKEVYAANVREFAKQMDEAVRQAQLKSSTAQPYWAYHDAFHYIEPTLKLNMVGALTIDHHLPPKASQFHWLIQNRPQPKMCILLQADSNQGVLSKLKPVTSSVQQEDMSSANDFISGWRELSEDINQCIGRV